MTARRAGSELGNPQQTGQAFGTGIFCALARVLTFRYPMVLKTILNSLMLKGFTDDDLLPDRSLRPGSQHESNVDARIGGEGPSRLSESR